MELAFQLAEKESYRPFRSEMMSLGSHSRHKIVLGRDEEFGSKRGKHAMN